MPHVPDEGGYDSPEVPSSGQPLNDPVLNELDEYHFPISSGQVGTAPMTPGQAASKKAQEIVMSPKWGRRVPCALPTIGYRETWEAVAQAAIDADPVRKKLKEAELAFNTALNLACLTNLDRAAQECLIRHIKEARGALAAAKPKEEKP